ncbi:MAG: ABC transporter permease subunit [Rhodospirillaceae bacterium]|jgi:ABC-type spermidine/putrescine transport system permease subunit I|nr:ABC transporter permease subunit [Rhodospirillaceae bacterium]MBT4044337.1 ABC transporter permease subunit [Rhodospirillaceae bacterium]MBT4689258.1 ABC transporter permease subunit [Rhodospirillaceae bacterium]MBT5079331.1 ABC transporter permease subunit [Rhodospirillaceae bacterium]MBT5525807.1 ABC transporter permease subunit [Rhodospirillaceae bacterium]
MGGSDITAPIPAARLRLQRRLSRALFLLPIIFMLVFFALPLALTVVWSVFERTMFWMKPGFTLFAYENFFFSARLENFLSSMMHSSVSVVVSFVLGFPIAVFVRRRIPQVAQHRVILLFILPFMVSEIIRIFALRPVLQRTGLVNTVLLELGVISEPITAILYTPMGVIIGEVMSFLPFIVFAGFLAMEAVPKYIFEICDDLGAPRHRVFLDVILPLAAPGIFAGGVFIFVNGLGVALLPNILGGPGAVNAGLIATQAISALDFPLAMAVSAIMMATLLGLLYLGHRLFDLTRILSPIN